MKLQWILQETQMSYKSQKVAFPTLSAYVMKCSYNTDCKWKMDKVMVITCSFVDCRSETLSSESLLLPLWSLSTKKWSYFVGEGAGEWQKHEGNKISRIIKFSLVQTLSHPGHGIPQNLDSRQLAFLFVILEDISSSIQDTPSVQTNWFKWSGNHLGRRFKAAL